MYWDMALNNRGTLAGGIVTGDDEILQRLWIRLNRELGEWFLNTEVGLPWYQGGYGILGAKPSRKNDIDLLIRKEIADTEGIVQILRYNAIYTSGTRLYDVYCMVLLKNNRTLDFSFGAALSSQGASMPIIPAEFIKFDNGYTLQELYDLGLLQGEDGEQGRPGVDGTSPTVAVGSTVTLEAGKPASVDNSGTPTHVVLDFGIPRGPQGHDGAQGIEGKSATIGVGRVTTGAPGTNVVITNVGSITTGIFDFTIPRGDKGADGSNANITVNTTDTNNVEVKSSGTDLAKTYTVNLKGGTIK